MKMRFAGIICFALALALGASETARAAKAAPPYGCWKGNFADGSGNYALTLTQNGGFGITLSGRPAVAGYFTWQATSRGGIITCHYNNAGFHNKLYYSVTYIDAKTIIWSDPYFKVKLKKLGN
jgi:hypothetical protein